MNNTQDLDTRQIGSVIDEFVPEKYRHFFAKVDQEDFSVDMAWWAWRLELDDEESVGTHVWNLIPHTCELLSWMPDATDEAIEGIWKAVGDQCLTWVYG
jgi:hypothetical protein